MLSTRYHDLAIDAAEEVLDSDSKLILNLYNPAMIARDKFTKRLLRSTMYLCKTAFKELIREPKPGVLFGVPLTDVNKIMICLPISLKYNAKYISKWTVEYNYKLLLHYINKKEASSMVIPCLSLKEKQVANYYIEKLSSDIPLLTLNKVEYVPFQWKS